MNLEAQGEGSDLEIPNLTSLSFGSGSAEGANSSLMATDGGQVDAGRLTAIVGVTLTLSDTSSIALGKVNNVDDSSVIVQAGAVLSLPWLMSYQAIGFTSLDATGADSELDLPNLTSMTDTSYSTTVEADNGGEVILSSLASLTANVDLEAEGQGSDLKIPNLSRFILGSGFAFGGSSLLSENGGEIDSGSLTTINGVTLTLSDTSSMSLGEITNIDDSSVIVHGGAMLSLSGVTGYQSSGFTNLEATGSGSELDLPNLTSITDTSFRSTVEADNGGTVKIASLANLTANVNLEAQGQGSVLNIPDLVTFSVGSGFAVGEAALWP